MGPFLTSLEEYLFDFGCSLTTACFRQLDHALACLRVLAPEVGNQQKLEHRTTLYISRRNCSADQATWVRWEEDVDLSESLPRIAVCVLRPAICLSGRCF